MIKAGALFEQDVEGALDLVFGVGVDSAGGVVKDDDARVDQ